MTYIADTALVKDNMVGVVTNSAEMYDDKVADIKQRLEQGDLSQEELMALQLDMLDAQQMLQLSKTMLSYEKTALNQGTQIIQPA